MHKLSVEERVVKHYLGGKSQRGTCKTFQLKLSIQLRMWIREYNGHELKSSPGGKRIMAKGRKTTFEERIRIVTECIKHEMNYAQTAEHFKVSYQQVYQWVHKYQASGVNGLMGRRGRTKPVEELSDIERLKALENKFLKKVDEIEMRRFWEE